MPSGAIAAKSAADEIATASVADAPMQNRAEIISRLSTIDTILRIMIPLSLIVIFSQSEPARESIWYSINYN